jgi:hypothetical protein
MKVAPHVGNQIHGGNSSAISSLNCLLKYVHSAVVEIDLVSIR